jgi:exosortase
MDLRPKWVGVDARSRWGPILIVLLILALFYPAMRWLVSEWLGNDYYSHGLLVPFVAAFLAWRLWVKWPSEDRHLNTALPGLVLLLAGLLIYLYALLQRAYFVASLAMIALVAGLIWYLLGPTALRRLAFPIAFLLFMVPLPFVEPLSIPLAQSTGVVAADLIRLLGVPIMVNGSQVTLPNASLVVGAQCSGMRSIVSLLTLVALVVFVLDGPWWGKLLLVLSSILIAVLGNVMRVSSLLVVANIWGAEAGFKYYHDYSSIVFFGSALALLLLFSRWVRCREIRDDIF